jgi:hypothetical protein
LHIRAGRRLHYIGENANDPVTRAGGSVCFQKLLDPTLARGRRADLPHQQVTPNPLCVLARPALAAAGFVARIPTYCLAFEARQSDQWSCMKTTHDGIQDLPMRKAKQSRPTRGEILGGIGYEPLTFPASLRVPEALRAEEDRALQDYIVAWTRVSGTSSMRTKAPRSIFCAAFWSNRAPQKAESLKLFRVFYRQHHFNVECGSVVVDRRVPLPQCRP